MTEKDLNKTVILEFGEDDCAMIKLRDIDSALREQGFAVVRFIEEEQKQ